MRILLLLILISAGMASAAGEYVFIGSGNASGEGGIFGSTFADGKLGKPRRLVTTPRAVTLERSQDSQHLFASAKAAGDGNGGHVITYAIAEDGSLTELHRIATIEDRFCAMAVSANTLIGASYAGGVVTSFSLDDHLAKKLASRIELPRFTKRRKKLARAHDVEFSVDGRHAFVPDIFNNRIYIFAVEKNG